MPRNLAGSPSENRRLLWSAMRMSPGGFRTAQLMELTGVGRKQVEAYLAALLYGGYVRVAEPGAGRIGHVYTLVRNTGPLAPRARNGTPGLFDPNVFIEQEREHHRHLVIELRKSETRLRQFGAYVERATPEKESQ